VIRACAVALGRQVEGKREGVIETERWKRWWL